MTEYSPGIQPGDKELEEKNLRPKVFKDHMDIRCRAMNSTLTMTGSQSLVTSKTRIDVITHNTVGEIHEFPLRY